MKDFLVIRLQGRQYIISVGDKFSVDKLKDPKIINYEVLLQCKDGKVTVGKPTLEKVQIKFKIIDEMVKGEKVRVLKYKSKSRFRKRTGFRAQLTTLFVEKIS